MLGSIRVWLLDKIIHCLYDAQCARTLGGAPRVKRYQIIMAYFNIGINRLNQIDRRGGNIIN